MTSKDVRIEVQDFTGVGDPANPGLDFPTAWAIQREVGETLDHDPRCSSVPGWHPLSGPGFLCDCGAVGREWERRCAAGAETESTGNAPANQETDHD